MHLKRQGKLFTDGSTLYVNKMNMGLMNEVRETASVFVGYYYDNASEESFNSRLKAKDLYNWFGKTKLKIEKYEKVKYYKRLLDLYIGIIKMKGKQFN